MPAWKVLFIVVFGLVCLALALATVVVPMTLKNDPYRWAYFGGLLFATVVVGTLFTVFLRAADRGFKR
jgi:bacteriorhodopsin